MIRIYLLVVAVVVTLVTLQAIHYIEFQDRMKQFVSQGSRFTALNGQELCERIQKLEKEPLPCNYNPKGPQ